MTNRTVQIYGLGFGSTDATITVTLDGNTIFDGAITTVDTPVPEAPYDSQNTSILCSFEIPVDFQGAKPMTCTVNNGTVLFAEIMANYCFATNPDYTPEEIDFITNPDTAPQDRLNLYISRTPTPFTQQEITTLMDPSLPFNSEVKATILRDHGVSIFVRDGTVFDSIGKNPRNNVLIDNKFDYSSNQRYLINSGSTMSYDLLVYPS